MNPHNQLFRKVMVFYMKIFIVRPLRNRNTQIIRRLFGVHLSLCQSKRRSGKCLLPCISHFCNRKLLHQSMMQHEDERRYRKKSNHNRCLFLQFIETHVEDFPFGGLGPGN